MIREIKMKIVKVISLAVLGFSLVNCDNSKSKVDDIKQQGEQISSEISDKAQQMGADISDKAKQVSSALGDKAQQLSTEVSDKAKDLYKQTESQSADIFNQVKEGNYKLAQDLIVNGVKTKLPVVVDQNTTLVEVSKGNDVINYKYLVKDTTKDALQTAGNQKEAQRKLLEFYCGDGVSMKALRLAFPAGAGHDYYINDDKVFSVSVKPSDCDDND
jgi:gas vesicle protein